MIARTTDLGDADTPESAAGILRRAAEKWRESVPDLQSAWQDPQAGKVWNRLARALDACADRCERIARQT